MIVILGRFRGIYVIETSADAFYVESFVHYNWISCDAFVFPSYSQLISGTRVYFFREHFKAVQRTFARTSNVNNNKTVPKEFSKNAVTGNQTLRYDMKSLFSWFSTSPF